MWPFLVILSILLLLFLLRLYLKLSIVWCRSQTCLVGKTAIVTGANTGIGYETALDFAKRGARVILACRDEARGKKAQSRIIEETGNRNVLVKIIDMASFESVRHFAKDINDNEERLDILVNNAGAGGIGDERSKDGHTLLMQINYFSSYLLTLLLIGLIKKSGRGRIVNVSSIAGKWAKKFNLDKLDEFVGSAGQAYCHSKLCNILFTIELARRLEGTGITTYSLHPGAVNTEFFRRFTGVLKMALNCVKNAYFKTSEEGAQTTIYCSVTKGIESHNGQHFDNCKRVDPYKTTKIPGLARKLWETTEEIVQLKPGENQL